MTNLEIVQGAYDGFITGNLTTLFTHLSDKVVWKNHGSSDSPLPKVSKGVVGVKEYFGSVNQELDIKKFDIQKILQEEGLFTVLIDVERTYKKNGASKNGQYVHVINMEEGKLVSFDAYEPVV